MKRAETMALLKELVANNLIQASWVSVETRKPKSYALKFKGDYEPLLEPFLRTRNLAIEENRKEGFFVIFKP